MILVSLLFLPGGLVLNSAANKRLYLKDRFGHAATHYLISGGLIPACLKAISALVETTRFFGRGFQGLTDIQEKWMVESRGSRDTFVRVKMKHFLEQLKGLIRNVHPMFLNEMLL